MKKMFSITELNPGDRARIGSLLSVNKLHLRKLTVFGILPGVEIELLQTSPTYVLRVEHTQLALDFEIAKNIFVWKQENIKN
ncbi:MAG: FeoA family protein [Veillonellales bacterium]